MDRQVAYTVAQRELESLASRPFAKLVSRVGKAQESRLHHEGHAFLVETSVAWSEPDKVLCLLVKVSSTNPQRFELLEERLSVTRPSAARQTTSADQASTRCNRS